MKANAGLPAPVEKYGAASAIYHQASVSPGSGEAFSDYDLPNDSVYAESCASIRLVISPAGCWKWKPIASTPALMERAVAPSSAVWRWMASISSTSSPLEVHPKSLNSTMTTITLSPSRQRWFGCPAARRHRRVLTSLGHYIYTPRADALHQYVRG